MHIVLIEDEKKINEMLSLYLKQEGHEVKAFLNAETALSYLSEHPAQLVISDLMLPNMQGETLIKEIRKNSDVYIIVLTAKSGESSKLDLLSVGVDDYINKPFSTDEVLLKVRNIEARLNKNKPLRFTFNENTYVFNEKSKVLYKNNETINLTYKESLILSFFIAHPSQVLSRNQIIEGCLSKSEAYDRIVDTYIKNLRKKLKDQALIQTIYGGGYKFRGVMYA